MSVARVIVDLSLDKAFDYIIPNALNSRIKVGVQVYVPFGHSRRRGYVVGIKDESAYPNLKEIEEICEKHPKIPSSLIKLAKWMSEYYCCSQEQAVKALLPGPVRSGKIKHKTIKYYYLNSPEDAQKYVFERERRSPAKTRIIKTLLQHPGLSLDTLLKDDCISSSALRSLVKEKIILEEKRHVDRDPFESAGIVRSEAPTATPEQQAALEQIDNILKGKTKKYAVLLHGVTGSGKTEVYLQAISKALKQDKDSIVLVPEISLTPQTTERFRSRFGDMVSALHSALSDGERFDEWTKINQGKVKIVVGARSALFAPFRKLGLIVVDEEHENTYKQEESPRYHARDVAVMRGYLEGAAVILGSATPSLESYYNTTIGKYALAKLTKRIDDCLLPQMRIVDMRAEAAASGKAQVFSKELIYAINDRLEKGEQTIIFLNRRGFATQMICLHCGFVAECSECSITYTYHRQRACLSCHLCGSVIPAYETCPKCKTGNIRYSGLGTEKIETIASKLFPPASIARMDSDTMTKKNSYEKVLREFRSGRIDILIGTQMIAKGLHFPNVTLVGIIYADLSLHIPDFRSQERTFQLLTQVAGRSGRGDVPGEVIVQTYTPFNSAIQYALKHDYENFYKEELKVREELRYPPVGHLTAVHFRGVDGIKTANFAKEFLKKMSPALHPSIIVSGPVPSPISKAKGKFRYVIIFRGGPMKKFREHLRELALHVKHPKDIDLYIDTDAINLM